MKEDFESIKVMTFEKKPKVKKGDKGKNEII